MFLSGYGAVITQLIFLEFPVNYPFISPMASWSWESKSAFVDTSG